jgi:phosphomevalonate kinase
MELLNINYVLRISKNSFLEKEIQFVLKYFSRVQQRLISIEKLSKNLVEFIESFQKTDSSSCNMPMHHSSNGIHSTYLPHRPVIFDGENLTSIGGSLSAS